MEYPNHAAPVSPLHAFWRLAAAMANRANMRRERAVRVEAPSRALPEPSRDEWPGFWRQG